MNPQLQWHVMDGTEVIKAGTPLAYYLLVPKDQKMIVKDADRDFIKYEKIGMAQFYSRFITSIASNKKFFTKLFKNYGEGKCPFRK